MEFLDAVHDPGLLALSPGLAEILGERAAATGKPLFALRRQRPYFLMGPGDGRLPRLGDAVRWAEAQGIPVFRRIGGGSLVYLDGGCLSFAAAIPCRDIGRLVENFHRLTEPVFRGLASLGVRAEFGAARGSYCEGPWDLIVGGRKVAGVAQALRRGFSLVSGMLLVEQDPEEATALVNAFNAVGGGPTAFLAAATTTVGTAAGRPVTVEEMFIGIRDALGETTPLELTADDERRVLAILEERRVHPDRGLTAP